MALILSISMLITLYALVRLEPIANWGLNFHLAAAVAVCTLIIQYIYVLGLFRYGIHGLGLFLLPATAIPLFIIPFLPNNSILRIQVSSIMEASHLIFSLLAYAILTLAMLHAIMHLLLDRSLKHKQIGPIVQTLPSLFDLENHMYAQVRTATWLLTLGIMTGIAWQWGYFDHHLDLISHKVILSIFSWIVLLVLLTMRKRAGWQGRRASWMVITAYLLLLLAYFGVRIVQAWLHAPLGS